MKNLDQSLRWHIGTILFSLGLLTWQVEALALVDNAELMSVSVPAGALAIPSTVFTQTWTMLNTGTTTWSPGASGYTLNLVGKDSLGAVPLSANATSKRYTPYAIIDSGKPVAPGAQAIFSMSFIVADRTGV